MKTLEIFLQIDESVKDLRVNYVHSGKIPAEIFDYYVEQDPSPTKKYVSWMCKQYLINKEHAYHYPDVVRFFDEYAKKGKLKKKDLYQYTYEELEKAIAEAGKVKTKGEIKKEIKEDVDIIYEDEDLLILHPKTHQASCMYGKNTKWCISSKKSNYHFKDYTKQGSKFYFIINKKTNKKYAVQVSLDGKKEAWNEKDQQISFDKLLSEVPALQKVMS